jgi:hypothetical protein
MQIVLSTAQVITIGDNDVCQSCSKYSHISSLLLCADPSFVERVQPHIILGIFDAADPLTALSTNHFRVCTAKNINRQQDTILLPLA